MNKKMLSVAVLVTGTMGVITEAVAFPEYVVPTGASGCTDCHLNNSGFGYKPGVLDAAKGGLAGLKAFLHPSSVTIGDTKPVLHPINQQWDVTVGDAPLMIPLMVSDAEDDNFKINGSTPATSLVTKGAVFLPKRTDAQSNLPVIDFKWAPTAAQSGQTYTVNFTAQETGAKRSLLSNSVTATINVWRARDSSTTQVKRFEIQHAQWINNALNLAGVVVFKDTVSNAQRKLALNTLLLKMRTNSGLTVGSVTHLQTDANGNWQKMVSFSGTTVPCTIKLNYEGLTATRAVKLAPKTCLQ